MNFKDYHILIVIIGIVAIFSFVFSGSGNFAEEMIGISLIVGVIVLFVRRGIMRLKKR